MTTLTQTFTRQLVVEDCYRCHVTFGMTAAFRTARLNDHGNFYCPAGHGQHYTGQSEVEVAREERDRALRDRDFARTSRQAARDQAAAAERSARAYRGHATRLRNLIARGVCPVPGCRRNFTNVREHMATEHPDYHQHEEQS